MMKFPPAVVDGIEEASARQYLVERGLPDNHRLFSFYNPADARTIQTPDGNEWLAVGCYSDVHDLCVDLRSGAVVEVRRRDGAVWFVNAGPEKFVASLDEFSRRYPFCGSSDDLETLIAAAEDFESALREIDGEALDAEKSYWRTVLFDVMNGDLCPED